MNSENKSCQNCKKDFEITPDDFLFYEKIKVPSPTLCPRCRRLRRNAWRNDLTLYARECSACARSFVSMYAPNKGFKVLCPKCFHSDNWDPYSFGMIYEPNRSFIDQVMDLFKNMPILGVINDNDITSINCLYTNDFSFSKNCAMVFIAWRVENVYNSVSLAAGKDLSDCLGGAEESNYTYDGVMANGVSHCRSVYWCASCINCILCYDCRGCQDCFMSSGLRNKKYYFKNTQYTKEEYLEKVKSYNLETRTGYKKAKEEFNEFIKEKPRKYADLRNCVNCTGADMVRSKNTLSSAFASFSEDSKYVHNGVTFKSCYDCTVGGETELAYECITPDQSFLSLVTIESWRNNNVAYSIDCHSSNNLFGCIGLKKGEYSILNKRYSKEEYESLKNQIIEDMKKRKEYGEFFPSKFSPYGLNETLANSELELNKEEALAQGYTWQDEIQQTKGKETIQQDQVPDSINDIADTFSNEILACEKCQRNYKILPDELLLYKRLSVPIPTECFFCRHARRESMRGGYDLVSRECDCTITEHNHDAKCKNTFETFYTEKETRKIFCEECYEKELI